MLNHGLSDVIFLYKFYRSLDEVNQSGVNNLEGVSIMDLTNALASIVV